MGLTNVEEILAFAIEKELEAHDVYVDLAERVERPSLRAALLEFAEEELGHKAKLEAIRDGSMPGFVAERAENLKVSDYVVDAEPTQDLDYRSALVHAMKAEEKARTMYLALADVAQDAALAETFRGLAREEEHHKHRFESAYEDLVHGE